MMDSEISFCRIKDIGGRILATIVALCKNLTLYADGRTDNCYCTVRYKWRSFEN
jgi:hypothetical protein